jgi:hypothetical protein
MKTIAQSLSHTDGFELATWVVAGFALAAALAVAWIDVRLALLPLAGLMGWCHLSSV